MRHRNKVKTLDREKSAREMLAKNLASSIIIYEKVKTTSAKAKVARPLLEKAITLAKINNLASNKRLVALLPQKLAYKKVREVLAGRYKGRNGGYCRITRLENRLGDGATQVQIELV